jgi:hypothetical protein
MTDRSEKPDPQGNAQIFLAVVAKINSHFYCVLLQKFEI